MDLREYLFRKRMTITAFSKQVNVTRRYLTEIVNGRSKPGPRLAKDITLATQGEVTIDELIPPKNIG